MSKERKEEINQYISSNAVFPEKVMQYSYTCDDCGFVFTSRENLGNCVRSVKVHMGRAHKMPSLTKEQIEAIKAGIKKEVILNPRERENILNTNGTNNTNEGSSGPRKRPHLERSDELGQIDPPPRKGFKNN